MLLSERITQLKGDMELKEMSELSGVSKYLIERILSGKTDPRTQDLIAIAHNCFDMSSMRLLVAIDNYTDKTIPSTRQKKINKKGEIVITSVKKY